MKVIYVCSTCKNMNKHNSDRPNFTPWPEEFDTFSDAWEHLFNTTQRADEPMHYMETEIRP